MRIISCVTTWEKSWFSSSIVGDSVYDNNKIYYVSPGYDYQEYDFIENKLTNYNVDGLVKLTS